MENILNLVTRNDYNRNIIPSMNLRNFPFEFVTFPYQKTALNKSIF